MDATQLSCVLVVGLGRMGRGIAETCALAGLRVVACDQDDDRTATAVAHIHGRLGKHVEAGKVTTEEAMRARSRITTSSIEHGAPSAQLAIEAAPDDYDLKADLLARIDARLPKMSIIATSTSSLSISKLAATTSRSPRVVGMHFMNPVMAMQLVEVVRGIDTSPHTLEFAKAFTERLKKKCIISEDRPGFVVNRLLIPLLNEACFALQEGVASVEDIDAGAQLGLNHPMGPLRLADFIGLDVVLTIAEALHREIGDDKYRPAVLLRNLVAAGRLGNKTGRGFYLYESGKPVGPALRYAKFTHDRE